MANQGGGAEAHARFKQYEYCPNSSQVLTTDSRPLDTHEPTGERVTLWGRIDRRTSATAVQAAPPDLQDSLTRSRKKKHDRDSASADLPRKRRRCSAAASEESVLSLTDDVVYRPALSRPLLHGALLALSFFLAGALNNGNCTDIICRPEEL